MTTTQIFADIQARRSVRSYQARPLEKEYVEALTQEMAEAQLLFADLPRPEIHLITTDASGKLGTYGVIHGAQTFWVLVTQKEDIAAQMQAAFVLEQAILRATRLGLGTIWLGGTFNKGQFAKAVDLQEGFEIPIVCPVGHPAPTMRWVERTMRRWVSSDQRKPFSQLFSGVAQPSISEGETMVQAADRLLIEVAPDKLKAALALEAVRWAPSSTNSQPWRVGVDFHWDGNLKEARFTAAKTTAFTPIDMAIAYCHFALAAQALQIKGKFDTTDRNNLPLLNFLR